MRKNFLNFIFFGITITILITTLKVLNWLPTVFHEGAMRKYDNIEEVRVKLRIKEVYIPSYFPQSIKWPPSDIFAQAKPFTAIVMEFKNAAKGDTTLIISQVTAGSNFIYDRKIKMLQTRERINYPLKGRNASLEVGVCVNDEPCSRISWDEGEYRINAVMKSTPIDLLKIAESMLH
ncbi:MAG: hypothetical protein HY754_12150 [Nitrospirae bacterium]|nr:hypothetical protein [Nitrospirota bacterium]